MTGRWPELAPRSLAALRAALVALGVLLLLPSCGALASQALNAPSHAQHHGDALAGDYCAGVATGVPASATERSLAPEPGALLAFAPSAPAQPFATIFARRPASAAHPPPVQPSFYVRSARILR
jgi:hypothetical protein